jgi:1-deoxy-D-xylulose-5-phosphate reductoisomerase
VKRILLFGSTGSIGRNVLDLVAKNRDRFSVELLSCSSNVDLLVEQAREFSVRAVHIVDENLAKCLEDSLPSGTRVYTGVNVYEQIIAEIPADLVVNAIVGAAGLELSYYTLRSGTTLALANKESLVAGGELLRETMWKTGAEILPIDSEHSAIWQCLRAGNRPELEKIILTASGGPFRSRSKATLADVTPEDALRHPNWSMGKKITIDSATMMNKGLEVIEACFLFAVDSRQIDIVVHPESIIHSLVQFVDGSQIAQLSPPDMRLPIAYALAFPERMATDLPRTDLANLSGLTFEKPDTDKFPCIALAYKALEKGNVAPLILNAANEIAVESFLAGSLKFTDVPNVIERMMEFVDEKIEMTLENLLQTDRQTRTATREMISSGTWGR